MFEPKHSALAQRFVDRFPIPAPGSPADDYRAWSRRLGEQFDYTFPVEQWGIKSAGEGRPMATDGIATRDPFIFYDVIIQAGAPDQAFNPRPEGIPLGGTEQIWHAVTPQDHLGTTPEKPQILLAYTLFWAVGGERVDPGRLDEQLWQFRDNGADCVRVIPHLPRTNSDGSPGMYHNIGTHWSDGDFLDLMRRTDDRLERHGLKWYCTFTAGISGIETEERQYALVDEINRSFAGRPGRRLTDEMANEYVVNGLDTTIVRRMAKRNGLYAERAPWVSPSSPYAAHGGPGDLHDEVRRLCDGCPEITALTPHWNRDTNAPPDLGPYAPSIVICGEPRGPKSSGAETSDPAVLIGDEKLAVQAGYALYVGHSDSGVISTFMYPGPVPGTHGEWRLYSDHHNGPACLAALRDYRLHGTEPEPGNGGGGEEPMIPYDEAKSIEFGHGCNAVYAESGAAFDAGMVSVHSQRAAWDFYVGGLTWPDSYHKHINEFRAVYGLPPV